MPNRKLVCTHPPPNYTPQVHTRQSGWEREEEEGAENTDMAPFLLESGPSYPRDHRPVSFLHVNELFSHLLEEEKRHRSGRPILGHTITAICIPPAAGLAQECALQLCGGKEFRKKGMGRGGILPGLSIQSSMIHFHFSESQKVEITPARAF